MFTTSVGYRLGLLMSTTCLNCARFYDGVKLFSFKRVYIRFSNFCQLLAKSTRQNWFSKKVHFLQIYNTFHCLIKTPRLIKPPPFLRENFQILKTCLITPPLRTKKYCTNYYIFSGVFGWWNLMKCLSPNALISLILPHYELFIEFESHGDNTLKMGKSNSSEKKKMKRPMFCPSLQRKSEGRRKLTSLPWSESIATWATLISGKCARQVRSRKHL